jgi:photosystem II stability/assembly factor-like uncharacterized protein
MKLAAAAVTTVALVALAIAGGAASFAHDTSGARTLAISPGNSKVVYAGTPKGIFKSTNGGRTWRRVLASGGEHQQLAIDPTHPNTVFAGTSAGVYRSGAGGRWSVVDQMRDPWLLAHDPKRPGILWSAWGSQLFISRNGGHDWHAADRGLPGATLVEGTAFAVDAKEPDTAYVAVNGVYKTTDGGKRWRRASKGLPSGSVEVLVIDPKTPKTLYAGTAVGVYKSTNSAATWRRLSNGHAHALAIDPRTPKTMYALGYVGGLVRSTDGGRTWDDASKGLGPGYGQGLGRARAGTYLFVDPRNTKTLYLLAEQGIYKSTNGAASWRPTPGQPGT